MFSDYTVIDLETTGLDPEANRITEIAARRYRNGKISGAMSILVWAGQEVPAECVALNGITTRMLECQGFPEPNALRILHSLLGDSLIIAHNASFEMSWLDLAWKRVFEKSLTNGFLCTKTFAVALKAGSGTSYSLKQLAQDYGIELTNAHRAMPDVVATKTLLDTLLSQYEDSQAVAESLLNCCGMGPKHYPQVGLPAHAKPLVQ